MISTATRFFSSLNELLTAYAEENAVLLERKQAEKGWVYSARDKDCGSWHADVRCISGADGWQTAS